MNAYRGMTVGPATMMLLLCMIGSLGAETRLASIFSDNMVLQRGQEVPIWGWAPSGEKITVGFAGQEKACAAGPDGKWMVKLDPMEVNSTGSVLTISGGGSSITINNILVGEVWLCGGQSNMGMHLRECFEAEKEIAGKS